MPMDMKTKLSLLWLFATLNYIYQDIYTLFDKAGTFHYSQGFILAFSFLIEIPLAMVLLSRILKYRANRWANIIAGAIMTAVQILTLFVGTPTYSYLFFSIIEMATTVVIVWYAWKWSNHEQ